MNQDTLLYFGEPLKALDDKGTVGGYLVRFSDENDKDLHGEFFTAKTYLGPSDGNGAECIFDHGFPIVPPNKSLDDATVKTLMALADRTFKPLKTRRDAVGIWAETVLNLRDDYEKHIFGLVKANKLGWSSGAPGHRVRKNENGEILSWPIAEGSLTPCPAEPMNKALTVKSLGEINFADFTRLEPEPKQVKTETSTFHERMNQLLADREDDGLSRDEVITKVAARAVVKIEDIETILQGKQWPPKVIVKAFAHVLGLDYPTLQASLRSPKTIKGMFEDELANRTPSTWELDSAMRCVIKRIAEAATASVAGGGEYEWEPKVAETMQEYTARLTAAITDQVKAWVEGQYDGEEFYVKSGVVTEGSLVTGGLDFDEHSELVVTAFRELAKRFRDNHELRKATKAGRVLSEKNRNRLVKMLEQIGSAVTDCQNLLEETKPLANETEKNAAYISHLRLKHQLQRQQIGV